MGRHLERVELINRPGVSDVRLFFVKRDIFGRIMGRQQISVNRREFVGGVMTSATVASLRAEAGGE